MPIFFNKLVFRWCLFRFDRTLVSISFFVISQFVDCQLNVIRFALTQKVGMPISTRPMAIVAIQMAIGPTNMAICLIAMRILLVAILMHKVGLAIYLVTMAIKMEPMASVSSNKISRELSGRPILAMKIPNT